MEKDDGCGSFGDSIWHIVCDDFAALEKEFCFCLQTRNDLMCRLVAVAALEHETFELLEEQSADRLATHPLAMQVEQAWESAVAEYDDFPLDDDAFEQFDFDR